MQYTIYIFLQFNDCHCITWNKKERHNQLRQFMILNNMSLTILPIIYTMSLSHLLLYLTFLYWFVLQKDHVVVIGLEKNVKYITNKVSFGTTTVVGQDSPLLVFALGLAFNDLLIIRAG